jgi:hypothetical protein
VRVVVQERWRVECKVGRLSPKEIKERDRKWKKVKKKSSKDVEWLYPAKLTGNYRVVFVSDEVYNVKSEEEEGKEMYGIVIPNLVLPQRIDEES